MTYIIISITLLVLLFFVKRNRRFENRIYLISIVVLGLLSCFRYGSGTDYFAYKYHYSIIPNNIMEFLSNSHSDSLHLEIGFKFFMAACKTLNLNFELFIMINTIVVMALIGYIIYKNSNNKLFSLFIFYSMYYHIYVNSGLRQGISMAIFIFAFYQFYQKDKKLQYTLCILLSSLFHKSSIIGLIVPLVGFFYKSKYNTTRIKFLIVILVVFLAVIDSMSILLIILKYININFAYTTSSINVFSILLRMIYLVFIFLLYKYRENKTMHNEPLSIQIYIFNVGILIYFIVARISILSRLTEYFMLLEIILIPNLFYFLNIDSIKILKDKYDWINNNKKNILFCTYILMIMTVFMKDIVAFNYQGKYHSKSIFDYPYVTIFDKYKLYSLKEMNSKYPR